MTLDERLLAGLTSNLVANHLHQQGWADCLDREHDELGMMRCFTRAHPGGGIDRTAIPTVADTPERRMALAQALAANAARDGLDLAALAAGMGL